MITLTPTAVEAAKTALEKRGTPDGKLRLGVKGGGCSGVSYVIEFADKARDRDLTYDFDGLSVIIDPKSMVYLTGSTLDYEKRNLMEYGFKFINPNQKSTCGCGTSFTV
jgi:iron-sulfur cluster assembly protein